MTMLFSSADETDYSTLLASNPIFAFMPGLGTETPGERTARAKVSDRQRQRHRGRETEEAERNRAREGIDRDTENRPLTQTRREEDRDRPGEYRQTEKQKTQQTCVSHFLCLSLLFCRRS